MKRTIYTLAFLPFIAFGVKTVADEGSLYSSFEIMADAANSSPNGYSSTQMTQEQEAYVKSKLSSDLYARYQKLTPDQKMQVFEALLPDYDTDSMSEAEINDISEVKALTLIEAFEQQKIIFEETQNPTPAEQSIEEGKTGTPANLADIQMQKLGAMPDTPASKAEQKQN
ncbi:MAG: hypothetical protein FJZ56_04275 [Chlamydiae bacterium]|nr:hypothetical protein [Chlamydiota bacterium]